jgi:hypothetical protein
MSGVVQYWMHNSGSAQQRYTWDDWKAQQGELWPTVNFPRRKRPTARRGDRMFWHAVGSMESFGDGRFFGASAVAVG